jgi:hypothetical protein
MDVERHVAPALLASDDERERSVATLRDAVVEGRLTLEEFSERVGAAQLARTQPELAALLADLPVSAPAPVALVAVHRAFGSRLVRGGPWELRGRMSFRSVFGTITLDLREARLIGDEVWLEVHNFFGTVTVIVPAGIPVTVDGGGLFASQVIEPAAATPAPGAPRLHIRVSGPGGTLYVRGHKPVGLTERLLRAAGVDPA